MDIEFTGKYAQNQDFGINFQAIVDDENIVCVVTTEALQDINPDRRMDEAENQFQENKAELEDIAREKIENGEVADGRILINSSDVT